MSAPSRRFLPWAVAAAILALDTFICIRNPGDLDRLLINLILALSAFVTLHARLLSLANAGFMASYGNPVERLAPVGPPVRPGVRMISTRTTSPKPRVQMAR